VTRVALVGLGAMGRNHLRVLSDLDGAELVAVCDKDAAAVDTVSRKHSIPGYTSWDEMLDRERLDAAIVVVPTRFHVDAGVAALERGLHVLVEKPMAVHVAEADQMIEAAERAGIEIRYYNIIYDLVDDVKKAMSGLLAPTLRETMLGNAQILEIFKVSKVGNIAGCRVTDGTVERGANVRLIRDNVVIHEGKLSQLKRFKDDAKEVSAGMECGMAFENYQDMRQGDVIECYRVETIQRSL
jgi:predicted dinucleotide-utilizing enzyme